MVRAISQSTQSIYRRLIKPLLFRQHPDVVHDRLLRLGKWVQQLPVVLPLLSRVWASRDTPHLAQTIDGIRFSNPIGLAAGFDKNIDLLPIMKSIGFGFMTGGSVTYYPCTGNPKPWFHRLPNSKSIMVNVGLANEGVEHILSRLDSYNPKWFTDFPLVLSVAKTNSPETCDDATAIADYIGSLHAIQETACVAAYEINISCPNAYGGEPFTTPGRLDALLQAVDALQLTKPVWVKMPINLKWSDFDALLHVITDHTVSSVVIGNLSKDRAGASLKDPVPEDTKGNLSGLPTQQLSDDLIAQTYRHYHDRLTIIGVGGIFNATDAYRKLCLGASLVGLVTGLIFEGPHSIGLMNQELAALLQKDGFQNIAEAIGSKNRSYRP